MSCILCIILLLVCDLRSSHGIFSHLSPVAGMKYDLKRVEEVYYDVKIRGLTANGDPIGEQGNPGQS